MGRRKKRSRSFYTPQAWLASPARLQAPSSTEAFWDSGPSEALSDAELFAQATQGIRMLQQTTPRVRRPPAPLSLPGPALQILRSDPGSSGSETKGWDHRSHVNGVSQPHRLASEIGYDPPCAFRILESGLSCAGLAPGVNFQLLRRLQHGHVAYQRFLDLHRYSYHAAHQELERFIHQALKDKETCVLVITGWGKSSPGGQAVLRGALPGWLTKPPLGMHVLAFCTAPSSDGGPGAFYVLLRRQRSLS